MITIKILLLLILSFLMFDCKGQTRKTERGTEELVDPIPPGTPFVLKRDNMFLDMSAQLGEENISGIVGLSVYIDSTGNLHGFRVIKLNVNLDGESEINFIIESDRREPYQKSDYPEEVQMYYSSIEKYVNSLQFERDEKVPLKPLNELTFIARLK